MSNILKVAILGASGYTGAELVRLLALHPHVEISALTADRRAGQPFAAIFPHLGGLRLPDLVAVEQVDFGALDFVFCGLPHGTTQTIIKELPRHVKVADLSADFRLRDVETYARWYGHAHEAPELQREAVYGLVELARPAIAGTRLTAVPGCYPTAILLPLVPLIEAGLIAPEGIIADAKSGVTGAGRAPKEATLHTEVSEGIHPYGIASHRHAPEIEQGLSGAAGKPVLVNFTPHLMPMNRGILASIYVETTGDAKAHDLRLALAERFEGEPFVRVLDEGQIPATRHVRGSNHCLINVFDDRLPGRAIIVSAIDNLVKGASGQAVQCFNLMNGIEETTALSQQPLFP